MQNNCVTDKLRKAISAQTLSSLSFVGGLIYKSEGKEEVK